MVPKANDLILIQFFQCLIFFQREFGDLSLKKLEKKQVKDSMDVHSSNTDIVPTLNIVDA